jgi:hypothetical protein
MTAPATGHGRPMRWIAVVSCLAEYLLGIAWPIPESKPVMKAILLSSFSIRYASVLDASLGDGSPAQFINADLQPRARAITR